MSVLVNKPRIIAGFALVFILIARPALAESPDLSPTCMKPAPDAVSQLPPPLNEWGQLICMKYGYVIVPRQGWIWAHPGGYSPAFIDAQMDGPSKLGGVAYFTNIGFAQAAPDDLKDASRVVSSVVPSARPKKGYRLDLKSNGGMYARYYFLADEKSGLWGVQCDARACDKSSVFMLINSTNIPQGARKKNQ
jgi:hypothetical protein